MTNERRRNFSLMGAIIGILLCVVLLMGSTYAWFTDVSANGGNVIKSGTLDVELYWADGTVSPEDATWNKAEDGPVFNYSNWEPGYTVARHVRIANEGSLALKFKLEIVPEGSVGAIADVIDVYYVPSATAVASRDMISADYFVGTLADLINDGDGAAYGILLPEGTTATEGTDDVVGSVTSTLVLSISSKVTGKEYEDSSVGTSFSLKVSSAQYSYESDDFGSDYDAGAEYPATADAWDGTVDISWYTANPDATEFTLSSAEQLAGFALLVDGVAQEEAALYSSEWNGVAVTFEGKTVTLDSDVDLLSYDENGERVSFDPIGYGYDVYFSGTFDGQGHTISNLYQNGWALGYSYGTHGGGFFASVKDATIKNVAIDNSEIVMECVDMGTLVGYSYGNCTYENITITNSSIANYNRYTGGLVGEVNGNQTFTNISIDESNMVSALWGTYDAGVGGVIGGKWGDATLTFNDVYVAARLDVFNDVCSNYQYYLYRLSGMLIGMSEEVTDGTATASYLTANNVVVKYGDWVDYTYCEFESAGKPSYAGVGDWKFQRLEAGYSYDGIALDHEHDLVNNDETHGTVCTFDQLFGGDKGVSGGKAHTGVTVIYND